MLKTGLKITFLLAALWIGLGLIWSMKKGGEEVSYVNLASIIKGYGSLQSSAIGMSTPTNRIILESDIDETIGKGRGWDISGKKGDIFRVVIANSTNFSLETENSTIVSPFRFDFKSKDGKQLKRGLYTGASKYSELDVGNGMEISGEGRTCKKIKGVFYVHEYQIEDNILQKAAIDFIQYCDGSTKGLYGSLRYNSGINPGCNYGSCTGVRRITQINGDNPTLNSAPESSTENVSGSSLNNNSTISTAEQEKIIADINAKIIKSWSERYPVVAKYCSLEKILKNFNDNIKLDKEICTNDRRPQIDGNKLLKAAGYPTKDPLTLAYIISIRGILEDEEIEKLLELEEKYDDSIKVGYAEAQAKITETNLENRTARGKLLGQLMTTLWAEREVILLKELLAGEGI